MKPALLPLTSFRFFAALAVLMCHRPRTGPGDCLPYEWHGTAGVTFFFLLSGFILAYTYHDRLVERRPLARRDFLIARAARILPAYLLAFVISLWTCHEGAKLLGLTFSGALWKAVAHLTLTQAFVPDVRWYFGFNPPAWSLSCEWFFYLTFPFLLLGLATGSTLRRLAVFAVASAGWAVALGMYLTAPTDPAADYLKWIWPFYISPLTRLFDFVCGVALGVLFVRLQPAIGAARGWRYWAWGLAELGTLGALWATLYFCPAGREPSAHAQYLSGLGYYLPAFGLLVWVGALGRGPLSRVMSFAPLVYLGELSYGIYIFHFPIFQLMQQHFHPDGWGDRLRVHGGTVLAVVVAIVVAALSYHFWETPIRRWVRGRPQQPAASEPLPAVLPMPEQPRRAA